MTIETVVRGGSVVTPQRVREADIGIENGRIVAVGDPDSLPGADRTVDADGRIVMPGVVDPHVHVDDAFSGDTYETASAAAALGGVTTFLDFGWQAWTGESSPYATESSLSEGIERKRKRAGGSIVDYGLHGGITREDPAVLDEIEAAIEAGVTSFKLYTAYDVGVSYGFIDRVFEELSPLGAVAVVHTEDPTICDTRTGMLREQGRGDPTDYPASRPDYAEAVSAGTVARLAAEHGAKFYDFHVSSRKALGELTRVRDDAGPEHVRAETCTHYLALTDDVYAELGDSAMIAPPIRTATDREALFEDLRSGTGVLDVVSSDHCGFTREQKRTENWWDGTFGANGLQTELSILYDEAINARGFSLPWLARVKSALPAKLFGLSNKGVIAPGFDADLVIYDPERTHEISADDNASVSDFSLFDGREVTGAVEKTLVRGEIVAEDGSIVAPSGHGRFVERDLPDWRADG